MMNWIELRTEEDVENFMERVEQFHDWYVTAFSYDPLAQSENGDLNLARFKMDVDALTVTFRWTCRSKRGIWPEVQVEFGNLMMFNFANFKDPDPLWGCTIEKTEKGWVLADDVGGALSDEEHTHPEEIQSNFLVICGNIRWRPMAVVTPDGPDRWKD